MNTKVAVVEDHEFYREGFVMALKNFKSIEVVYEAANGREFIEKQQEFPADIVFMDLKMPVMDGYQAIQESKKQFPYLKVVVLTMFEEESYIARALEAGVHGYIIKSIEEHTLQTALNYIIHGKPYFSNELMTFFVKQLNAVNYSKQTQLTPRELEILKYICNGYSNSEIAEKLFLSYRTIANHRANLKKKTQTRNTAELIRFGIKNRIILP